MKIVSFVRKEILSVMGYGMGETRLRGGDEKALQIMRPTKSEKRKSKKMSTGLYTAAQNESVVKSKSRKPSKLKLVAG